MVTVLNLVTNDEASFYRQQTAALADAGVTETTLAVPGEHRAGETTQTRSVVDYLRFYPRAVRESLHGYDLVHANQGLTAPGAVAQRRLPVVVSLWGLELLDRYASVTRWCARQADAVVVMSPEMDAALDRDCHVIPHGVDMEQFAPRPRGRARAALGWADDRRHVLFPYSRHRWEKDFPRARRVFEAAAARLDDPAELHTPFRVPHEEMPRYLNAADALLLTSRKEGSPNVLKEALACNLPVVSTDVGDVRERLDGVSRSFVCRTDRALVARLREVLATDRRSDGREHVTEVRLERMTERLLTVYEEVLS
jgi:glycosyltransferase involved in cell wall biosynthesis